MFKPYVLAFILNSAFATYASHNVTFSYNDTLKEVVVSCIVPKDQWFALAFAKGMTAGGGGVRFVGKDKGSHDSIYLDGYKPPESNPAVVWKDVKPAVFDGTHYHF
tara:strand:+ start:125 stop:442 length:318 start_codon:yes stop_codon:yes gene_type:complete